MVALLEIAVLYDVDIINDSFTLLHKNGLDIYQHIPLQLRNLYLKSPQIIGRFCGKEIISVEEKTNGQYTEKFSI